MVNHTLDRRAVVEILTRDRQNTLIITGLGSSSYDMHAAGDNDDIFYLWGAMGSAALVGLGLAQAQPNKHVMVLTGDGEQLMGLGGLATIAVARPRNLTIVVLDNGHFGETGMQLSHTGHGINLASIAAAAGFAETGRIWDEDGVGHLAEQIRVTASGPRLFVVQIKAENLPRSLPVRDAVYLKNRMRIHLGLSVT